MGMRVLLTSAAALMVVAAGCSSSDSSKVASIEVAGSDFTNAVETGQFERLHAGSR
jgi:ABC-type phosphate/phosphonate transport system substrate-binding protein